MYWKDTFRFRDSIEYEFKYAGNYGAKGERRGKRKKPTKEQIAKQNQKNREKSMRRLIKANFQKGDLWCTLTYPAGTRKTMEETEKSIERFMNRLKYRYRKRGSQLKWIRRVEIGKRGGIHLHMIINRIRDADLLIQEAWTDGRVHFEALQEEVGELAAYIVKPPPEGAEDAMKEMDEKDRKRVTKYSCSRNLIHPKPERKHYRKWTMRKLVENGPEPSPGYYIVKSSIVHGLNPFTGMNYYQYEERRIEGRGKGGGSGG